MIATENTAPPATLPPTSTTEITGTVRAILWSNWDECAAATSSGDPAGAAAQGFVIARLSTPDVPKQEIVVKGPCPEDGIEVGMAYRFLGKVATHPQYGEQFQFRTFCRSEPTTRSGTLRYLVKLAPNIGEVKACKLWDRFGSDAVKTVRTRPDLVAESGILSHIEAEEAAAALTKVSHREGTKIDLFGIFDKRGFPNALIEACIGRWGAKAGQRIRSNPFGLLVGTPRLPGCGFKRCDKLYLDLGGNPAALKRQMLAAWHALREDSSGFTWMPMGVAREAICKAVGDGMANPEKAIRLGIRARWLSTHTDADGQTWIAEAQKAANERHVAEKLLELRRGTPLWFVAHCHIPTGEEDGKLSTHQANQMMLALREPVGILAGTPGTGKTWVTAQLVKWLDGYFRNSDIAVCAPTGKAAVRCTAAMKAYGIDKEATTIHRRLQIQRNGHDGQGWNFFHNATNPLPFKYVIIDEASMVDTDIAAALLLACAPGTHVLFVGDPYQLPPVGHGAPLRDMIAADIACGELSVIRRNSGLIVEACAAIKSGKTFETAPQFVPPGKNLRHLDADDAEESVESLKAVLEKFRNGGKFDPVWDCQVLVAVNGKSKVSRKALNTVLQEMLNPTGETAKDNPFRVDDKVICTKNSQVQTYELKKGQAWNRADSYVHSSVGMEFIANGEIGRVLAVAPKLAILKFSAPDRICRVPLGKPKIKDLGDDQREQADPDDRGGTGCDFELAYAITTHKSQGSEWPVAIVMIDESPGAKRVACREHVYTAISRAKQLCLLIGKMPVLEGLCRKVSLGNRKTFLKELLEDAKKPKPYKPLAPAPAPPPIPVLPPVLQPVTRFFEAIAQAAADRDLTYVSADLARAAGSGAIQEPDRQKVVAALRTRTLELQGLAGGRA